MAKRNKSRTKSSGGSSSKKSRKTEAQRSDRHSLYQRSVQTPEADVEFFDEVFRSTRGRTPLTLHEDFCGTAYLSTTWVRSHDERHATGIDIDARTLAWGREHNFGKLTEQEAARIELIEGDVLSGAGGSAELVCAMNFSYGVFFRRSDLKAYLQVVFERLVADGMFFTELYGGTEAIVGLEEERDCGDFTYVWEQEFYNPITHQTRCHIHYMFDDGSRLERAFSYEWRLWTIAELRDLLEEVGFSEVRVYWELTDEDGEGTGDFAPTEVEENQESWLVYIVASK